MSQWLAKCIIYEICKLILFILFIRNGSFIFFKPNFLSVRLPQLKDGDNTSGSYTFGQYLARIYFIGIVLEQT